MGSYIVSIYNALFSPAPVIKVANLTLKKKRIAGLRAFETPEFLFIEQNPRKASKYAMMARKGSKIMWTIRKKDDKYVAVVIEGKLRTLVKPGPKIGS